MNKKKCTIIFSSYIQFQLEVRHATEAQWVVNAFHVDFKPAAVVSFVKLFDLFHTDAVTE